MLTRAILTGGVLSAVVGCIVYFGTTGLDARAGAVSYTHLTLPTIYSV